jgi:hypothetical protein
MTTVLIIVAFMLVASAGSPSDSTPAPRFRERYFGKLLPLGVQATKAPGEGQRQ